MGKVGVLGGLIAVLLVIGVGLMFLLRELSHILTIPGVIAALLLVVLICANKTINLVLFPSSSPILRRSVEVHFCKEMSKQLDNRIQDIHLCLEVILDLATTQEKDHFLPTAAESLLYSKRMVNTVIDIFLVLKADRVLTKSQNTLMNLLVNLQISLQEVRLVFPNSDSKIMWD